MLTKEKLLKNYEKLNNVWLRNAPYILLGESNASVQELVDNSERYDIIRKIGHILYHCEDYEAKINKIVDNLTYKIADIWEKSLEKTFTKSCHWKREGFKSKEAYREYLENEMFNIYGWNSDEAYKAYDINIKLNDISIITEEDYIYGDYINGYELCY